MWASSLFPHLSRHVDKMAFIKSFHTQSNNHSPALFMANTGTTRMGHPCVGSWVTYGLGTENENLPAFVVMSDPLNRGLPKGHAGNWSSGFLPGAFQGTWVRSKGEPIPNLKRLAALKPTASSARNSILSPSSTPRTSAKHPGEVELDRPDQELRTRLPHAAGGARVLRGRQRARPHQGALRVRTTSAAGTSPGSA